jgi:CheY-like chemotaxis protein
VNLDIFSFRFFFKGLSLMVMNRMANVLIVEDNRADQRLLCDAIGNAQPQIRLHTIENGSDAIPFLQQTGKYSDSPRPDLIILDLNLPGKDGRDILKEIKSDPTLKCIPVVVLSNSDAPKDIRSVYTNAGNTYFTKPPELQDFLDVIGEIQKYWLTLAELPDRCAATPN